MRAECSPSSSVSSKAFKRKYVIEVLKENNYPKDFLQNCLKPVNPSQKTSENNSSMIGFAVPSIHEVTEPIKRILCGYNVKIAQKPFLTFKSYFLQNLKDPVPKRTKIRHDIFHPVQ